MLAAILAVIMFVGGTKLVTQIEDASYFERHLALAYLEKVYLGSAEERDRSYCLYAWMLRDNIVRYEREQGLSLDEIARRANREVRRPFVSSTYLEEGHRLPDVCSAYITN